MSSPWKTGSIDEATKVLPEIEELAKMVLSPERLDETNKVAYLLSGSKLQRRIARRYVISRVPRMPTRPLLYLLPLIMKLPGNTRDPIRYVGDYIDLLIKEMTHELVGGNARKSSLGRNVEALNRAGVVPKGLVEFLRRFNNFLYAPGKHDFSLPPGREHRFTSKEAVLAIYVSIELGERIKSLSRLAKVAVEKDNLYMIGGRWGSSKRVEFAE